MTWGEFKEAVEALDVVDEDRIWFIDVQGIEGINGVDRSEEPNLGVAIT